MTLDTQRDPPRLTHQEILEREQTRANHVVDVILACQGIMTTPRTGIERCEFSEVTHVMETIEVIISEKQNAMQYRG